MIIDQEIYDLTPTQTKIARPPVLPPLRQAPASAPEPEPFGSVTTGIVHTINFMVWVDGTAVQRTIEA